MPPVPSSILIVGSGVFGLATAYALTQRPEYSDTKITVLDRSPFPSPDGSSIDSSRIIRADYSDPAYASLAAEAQTAWRKQGPNDLGGEGRYTESGLMVVAHGPNPYVKASYENVRSMSAFEGAVEQLPNRASIERTVGTGGGTGDWGYLNKKSGWANAEASMRYLRKLAEATHRITFLHGTVSSLLFSSPSSTHITGVTLSDSSHIHADLTILATGAWTPSLIDLRGRATATGQVLMYISLTPAEQALLEKMPVILNLSHGMFIIPPTNRMLKVARHAYGYVNPTKIRAPNGDGTEEVEVSLPLTTWDTAAAAVPPEGQRACRAALRDIIPALGERAFGSGRVCWYTDTPTGDFLIDFHPSYSGLFLATGGSGHGFKFLPVIGERIVDALEGRLEEGLRDRWRWREEGGVESCEDGSRGGRPGMVLREEMEKGGKL